MKLLPLALLLGCLAAARADAPVEGPLTCQDPASGTLFYVESDGRHVSAIGKDGKLLWCTDMSKDMAESPFHLKRATRISLRPDSDRLFINFGEQNEFGLTKDDGRILSIIRD